ncbi:type II toxin-antitoxin system VapC family toxin [Thermus tengchongensis]|uniref:PIN domain-containing protein n=1 Tax=Thermus tengchongensis TaxID=1214928 RepID=A0A4Y9FB91_9DEIN|nr:type II toxin-antitoxin system VapC family toxin [Thermus tengchongensis]TFU25779.1 PIN domain-containing protein [Thermus tengchongensis]
MRVVLDASALLAFLLKEPGGERVKEALLQGAVMGAVNLAEVGSKLAERGLDPGEVFARLRARGILGQTLEVFPFTEEDALEAARLRPLTRPLGLSLGDRACLALARRLGLPALTADATWEGLDVGVKVEVVR